MPTSCAASRTRPTTSTATSRSRSSPTSRTTPRARSRPPGCTGSCVDRPNLMIKIPGTTAGVPAIEQAIYEGINVNVTLLFSVEAYANVAEAYIRGLERRKAEGKPLDVHSVASFFVSRVDTEVDKRLEKLGREDLQGNAGLANARAAYQRFRDELRAARWRRSAAPVAAPAVGVDRRQEPALPGHAVRRRASSRPTPSTRCRWRRCWPRPTTASSTARPRRHRPGRGPRGASPRPASTSRTSPTQLLDEGIATFVTPMDKLLAGIESKREAIVTHRPRTFESNLPDDLEQAVARAHRAGACARTSPAASGSKDPTLWGGDASTPGARRPARLADHRRPHAGRGRRPARLRARVHRRRAHRRRAARHGRLVPGARGVPPRVPGRRPPPAPARARLDRPGRGAGGRGAPLDLEQDAVRRLDRSPAGRSRRSRHFQHFWEQGRRRGEQFVAITDPGSPLEELATRARLPARLPRTTRTSAGATARCRTSASSRPRSWAPTSRRCSTARRSPRRAAAPTTRRRATRACGSARRSASWRCAGATS